MSEISEAMLAARKRYGCSRKWLSSKSGVSKNTIYEYETGRHEPGMYNLVRLADTLQISIDEYIGRKRPWLTPRSNATPANTGEN